MYLPVPLINLNKNIILFKNNTLTNEVKNFLGNVIKKTKVKLKVYLDDFTDEQFLHLDFKDVNDLQTFVIDAVKYSKQNKSDIGHFYSAILLRTFVTRQAVFIVLDSKDYVKMLEFVFLKMLNNEFNIVDRCCAIENYTSTKLFTARYGQTINIALKYINDNGLSSIDKNIVKNTNLLYWIQIPKN